MNDGRDFESYVSTVYSALLNMKGGKIVVSQRTTMIGKSGAPHELDIYYEFLSANVKHKVAIEVKDTTRPVEKADIMEFDAKIRDIGGLIGVVVSKNGYQSGAVEYAKHWNIMLLESKDLPAIGHLIANILAVSLLPDENCHGEPFWVIMEKDNSEYQLTGSYYTISPFGSKNRHVPLMYSKKHAEILFRQCKLDGNEWAIRGLPRYTLKGFIQLIELFESRGFEAAICFWPPGADETYPPVGFPISNEQLALEYYGEIVPKIGENITTEEAPPKNRRNFLRENTSRPTTTRSR